MDPLAEQTEQPIIPQPIQQPVVQTVLTPSPLPKIVLIILGVVIVLGLIGGAYYLGIQRNTGVISNEKPVMYLTKTATISKTPTSTPDVTGNWNTFTSDQYLNLIANDYANHDRKTHTLTFQYPTSWKIEKASFNNTGKWLQAQAISNLNFELHNPEADLSHSEAPANNSTIFYLIYGIVPKGTKDFDPQFWGSNYYPENFNLYNIAIQKMSINNIPVSKIEPDPSSFYYLFHISDTEELLVLISFWNFDKNTSNTDPICGGNEDCKTIQEQIPQIISTFKISN